MWFELLKKDFFHATSSKFGLDASVGELSETITNITETDPTKSVIFF